MTCFYGVLFKHNYLVISYALDRKIDRQEDKIQKKERIIDREKERQIYRDRYQKKDRYLERKKLLENDIDRQKYRQIVGQNYRKIRIQEKRKNDRQIVERKIDRQRQIVRKKDRQLEKKIGIQRKKLLENDKARKKNIQIGRKLDRQI